MRRRLPVLPSLVLIGVGSGFGQSRPIDSAARKFIDAGNQAWVDAMKSGDAAKAAAAYSDDAINCGPTGECQHGRAAIEAMLKERMAQLGHAQSASVKSAGSVQRGNFVYEWGSARAYFTGRREIAGPYLTVWKRQKNGTWKIFRNLALPATPEK